MRYLNKNLLVAPKVLNGGKMKVLNSIILLTVLILSNSIAQNTLNLSSENITFLGNYPFGPCRAVAVSTDGSQVYLGNGGFLRIIDLAGVDINVVSIKTPGLIYDIEVYDDGIAGTADNYIYLANGESGFSVVDISRGEVITELTDAPVYNIYIDGNTAYLANDWGGIIRITNIDIPSDIILEPIVIEGATQDIIVSGNTAYMANRDLGIVTFNIDDPSTFESYPVEGEAASIILYEENLSEVNRRIGLTTLPIWDDDGTIGMNGSVQVFTLQDLTSPVFKFGEENENYTPYSMTVEGDNIFVAEGGGGLGIYDFAGNWQYSIQSYTEIIDVDVTGNNVLVADEHGGLGIKYLDNLSANWFDQQVDFPSTAINIEVYNNIAFIADYEGVLVLDVSNPEDPIRINYIKLNLTVNSLLVSNNQLYICYWGGVSAIDLSNFDVHQLIEVNSEIYNLSIDDNLLFFAADTGLGVIDIDFPSNSEIFSVINNVRDLEVDLPYVYAVHYSDEDFSSHFSILEIVGTEMNTNYSVRINNANSLSVQGEFAYLDDFNVDQNKILKIIQIDLENDPPLIPISSLQSDDLGYIINVYASENRVYLATDDEGLNVVDIRNPLTPRLVGNIDTPGEAYALDVVDDKIYIADNSMGISIVRDDGVIPVEFICDMTNEISNGNFNPDEDILTVSGNFNGWSDEVMFRSPDDSNIFSKKVYLGAEANDTIYNIFSYSKPDGEYKSEAEDGIHIFTQNQIDNRFAEISRTFYWQKQLTIISPNGGEIWYAGTTHNITWSSENVSNINLIFSIDGGTSSGVGLVINGLASAGSYEWTIPEVNSDQCLVIIWDDSDGDVTDVSDSTFSILLPADKFEMVDIPASYFVELENDKTVDHSFNIMKYEVTNSQYVEFLEEALANGELTEVNSNSVTGYYDGEGDPHYSEGIYEFYDLDGDIESFNVGKISWDGTSFVVPSGFEEHPVILVTWFGARAFAKHYGLRLPTETEWEKTAHCDVSNCMYYPWGEAIPTCVFANYAGCNGGTVEIGQTLGVSKFEAYDLAGNVWEWTDSYISETSTNRIKCGGSWNDDVNSLRDSFRGDDNPTKGSITTGFRCAETTAVTEVISPNGGEEWIVGSAHTLDWSFYNQNSSNRNVRIEYSTDNGNTWEYIVYDHPWESYEWTIPDTPSDLCLVRISASFVGGVFDISDATFSILPESGSQLTLISPLGGETWYAGNTEIIRWHNRDVSSIKIELSTDGGAEWIVIQEAFPLGPGFGEWAYSVPSEISSSLCLVRLSDINDPSVNVISNALFSIFIKPGIALISPNGGETIPAGSSHRIEMILRQISDVIIEYNTEGSEETWQMIGEFVPVHLGSIWYVDWEVPYIVSNQCKIMISSADDLTIFDRSDTTFTIFDYPETINLSRELNFGDVTKTSSYRMIGMPGGDFSLHITDFISGNYGDDWRMFGDTGEETNYLLEYSPSRDDFGFAPGQGYWLVSRSGISINQDVNNMGLEDGFSYAIPLNRGWTIISNPFINTVSWQAVKDLNNLDQGDVIHGFNGSYSVSSTLRPYIGYYFYNSISDRSSLKIPYQIANQGTLPKSDTENLLQIILDREGEEKSGIGIAYNEDASETFDGYDILKPRGDFEDVSITIYNDAFEIPYKDLYAEYRSELGEGQIYDIRIKVIPGEPVELQVEGLELFENYEIVLHDLRLNNFYDLRNNGTITYSSLHKDNKFNLLIGDAEFVNGIKDKIVPAQFELYQNYPNPFNPRTIIRFASPVPGYVNLSVYNSLGELIEVILADKYYEQGFYEVEFDGANLASGIYFYKIQSGSFSDVKKLVLIK